MVNSAKGRLRKRGQRKTIVEMEHLGGLSSFRV